MRTIEIKKDNLGFFVYRVQSNCGWFPFPDNVKNKFDMNEFFKQGGHYGLQNRQFDPVEIKYVDNQGQDTKYYTVDRKGNFAIVNNDKRIIFEDYQVLSDSAQIEFLKGFSDREIDEKASKIENERERLNYYKSHADKPTLDKLKESIRENRTDEKLTEICQNHAKVYYNNSAKVEFVN